VLAAVDSPEKSVHDILGKAQYAIAALRDRVENESWGAASRDVEDLILKRGWRVKTDNPARQALTGYWLRCGRWASTTS
jgi:hypothetical protein